MDSLDILFFAVLSVVLLARLWYLLGRNDFDDGPRKAENPFRSQETQDILVLPTPKAGQPATPAQDLSPHGYAARSLAGTLDQWRLLDPYFDEKTFLAGARAAFQNVLCAFATDRLESIARLLSPNVYTAFEQDLSARKARSQTLELSIDEIKDAEIVSAALEGTLARLQVRFTSQQRRVLRDAQKNILSGDPNKAELVEDLWTFQRDSRSENPNWRLIETKA